MTGGKTIICQDCGKEFFFSDEEQNFYRQKGLAEPKFCPICRARKKAEKQIITIAGRSDVDNKY